MGYLQVLNLMVKAYKAARGVMPKGIDMLKLKMKARQKAIDSTKGKILQFPKERITDWTKARPQPPKIKIIKGIQTTRGLGDLFKRQMAKKRKELDELIKKGDVKIGQAPKTTKRKPAVDPKLTQEENIKRIMAENKAAAKRLQEKMNKPEKSLGDKLKDYKGDPDAMREGGLMGYAVGGRIQNLRNAYQANPTLQNQFTEDQYLDLFDKETITTPTSQETAFLTDSVVEETPTGTLSPNIVKPLIIPQTGGDSDGINNIINKRTPASKDFRTAALHTYGSPVEEEEENKFGIMDVLNNPAIKYNPLNPMFAFNTIKAGFSKGREKAMDVYREYLSNKLKEEEARLQAQLNRPRVPGGTIDSGNQGSGGYGGTGGEGPSAVGSSGMLGGGV